MVANQKAWHKDEANPMDLLAAAVELVKNTVLCCVVLEAVFLSSGDVSSYLFHRSSCYFCWHRRLQRLVTKQACLMFFIVGETVARVPGSLSARLTG